MSPLPPSAASIAANSAALDLTLKRLGLLAAVLTPTRSALSSADGRLRKSRQTAPSKTKMISSATDQTHQPVFGARNAQAPSCQVAIELSCPAHAPVAPLATTCRSPSAGADVDGGAVSVRSSTPIWIAASRIRRASLWVTCFCAWLPSIYGIPRFGVSVMATQRVRVSSVGWPGPTVAETCATRRCRLVCAAPKSASSSALT